jgi:D-alanyl-D-alanine dipeptidase
MKSVTLAIVAAVVCCAPAQDRRAEDLSPIPASSQQLILVLAESADATSGTLYRFERSSRAAAWSEVGKVTPIALGRAGLGLGAGLHYGGPDSMPVKREGDGRSPAGVFRLGSIFGYAPEAERGQLGAAYLHLTDGVECVDDSRSDYYNRVVDRGTVESVDWETSEVMRMDDVYYETGIVVEHNTDPVSPGAGSCIFLHNWTGPSDTTAGCTSMEPAALSRIVEWIDSGKEPVLVQVTKEWYADVAEEWGLPRRPIAND